MVLDQKQTPTTHVPRRQVIDGQQRLTTLQIFLAALRDVCREQGCEDLADECKGFTLNRGMMASPDVDQFKVRPTQADRQQFRDVIASGSRTQVETCSPNTAPNEHPNDHALAGRKPNPGSTEPATRFGCRDTQTGAPLKLG